MSGPAVDIKVTGESFVIKRLQQLQHSELTPVLFAVGSYMKTIPLRAIESGTDPVHGKPWAALSPVTLLTRRGTRAPLQDTGLLLRSISASPVNVHENSVSISTNRPQARILQEGGIIRPVDKKYLIVPLNTQARNRGARATIQGGGFFLKSKKGTLLIGHKKGKKIILDFWLTRQVAIPPRPYFGFGDNSKKQISTIIHRWLKSDVLRNS